MEGVHAVTYAGDLTPQEAWDALRSYCSEITGKRGWGAYIKPRVATPTSSSAKRALP